MVQIIADNLPSVPTIGSTTWLPLPTARIPACKKERTKLCNILTADQHVKLLFIHANKTKSLNLIFALLEGGTPFMKADS